jgi:hypothetical protein
MIRKGLMALGLCSVIALSACAGMSEDANGTSFTTHAESFRIIGLSIPHDDKTAAMDLVPAGATITTISSTPADWTSFLGFLNNLIGFSWTSVSGVK